MEHNSCNPFPTDRFIVSVKTDSGEVSKAYCAAYGKTDAKGFADKQGSNYLLLHYAEGHGTDVTNEYLEVDRVVPGDLVTAMRLPVSWRGGNCKEFVIPALHLDYGYSPVAGPDGGLKVVLRQKPLDPREGDTCADGRRIPRPPAIHTVSIDNPPQRSEPPAVASAQSTKPKLEVVVRPIEPSDPYDRCHDTESSESEFLAVVMTDGKPIATKYICTLGARARADALTDQRGRNYLAVTCTSEHGECVEIDQIDPALDRDRMVEIVRIPLAWKGNSCVLGLYSYSAAANVGGGLEVTLRNEMARISDPTCKGERAPAMQIIRIDAPSG